MILGPQQGELIAEDWNQETLSFIGLEVDGASGEAQLHSVVSTQACLGFLTAW